MNIGQVSQATGLSAKTIRYYEDIGLVKPGRSSNGYRDYGSDDIHRLTFLRRSRGLGFTVEECRSLLSLYANHNRASSDVKALTLEKIAEIDKKLQELKSLRKTLQELANTCHGDARPDCPIIAEIAGTYSR